MLHDKPLTDYTNPLELFTLWYTEAQQHETSNPNAMALATVDVDQQPHVRMLLLKGFGKKGFNFYTNLTSPKANQLTHTPKAELCFYWKSTDKQIRITGTIEQIDHKEADDYFSTRDRDSQIGAWASKQSQRLDQRDKLDARLKKYTQHFANQTVERPEFWSGFRLIAKRYEFWQQGENRLHDRLEFVKNNNQWEKHWLYP